MPTLTVTLTDSTILKVDASGTLHLSKHQAQRGLPLIVDVGTMVSENAVLLRNFLNENYPE